MHQFKDLWGITKLSIFKQDLLMGNQPPSGENFNHKEWTQVTTNPNLITLWQNNHNRNIHIEQHRIYTVDQQQFMHQRQLYFQRKNHPFWVAAYYFEEEKSTQICSSRSVAHIFIEKIPIKIFDLRDLPLPDHIHAYNQSLEGYKTLARELGCFRVSSQFIGVNQKGIVKVWAGSQWSQIGIVGNRIGQEEMVRSIVESLESCNQNLVNQHISAISIKNFLYRNTDRLTFDQAIQQLRNFAIEFNHGLIPSRLQSLYHSQNFEMFLDPLLRSNHNLQQSKHISHPQSTNAQATFRKVESGQIINSFGQKKQESGIQKQVNKRPSLAFFSCMADDEKLKTSKIMTSQEALNLYTGQPQINPQTQQKVQNPPTNNYLRPHITPITIPNPAHNYPQYFMENKIQNTMAPPKQPPPYNQLRSTQRRRLMPAPSQPNLGSSIHFQYIPIPSTHIQPQTNHNNYHMPPLQALPHHPLHFNHPNQVTSHSVPKLVQNSPTITRAGPIPQTQINQKLPYTQNERRRRPIPESIIMQLYTPQEKSTGADYPPLKSLGLVKQSISEMEQPQNQVRFDSATLIKDGQPNSLIGVPNNLYFPHTNSNLQSIQELSSQYWKNDNISYTSTPSRSPSELHTPWRQSEIKKYDYSKLQSRSNSNYLVDPNDGKTSEDFMRNIMQGRNIQKIQQYPQNLFR